ncbi:hypothetical protein B0H14DRAFT_3882810 [Mycena olivaceomarginata]|nr:hypothetical protein B0H14DRAFT_3882810 [Mycena olivaceomarginata]
MPPRASGRKKNLGNDFLYSADGKKMLCKTCHPDVVGDEDEWIGAKDAVGEKHLNSDRHRKAVRLQAENERFARQMEDERDMARGAALSELNRVHIHPEYLAGPMAESSSAVRERAWEGLRLDGATGADFGFKKPAFDPLQISSAIPAHLLSRADTALKPPTLLFTAATPDASLIKKAELEDAKSGGGPPKDSKPTLKSQHHHDSQRQAGTSSRAKLPKRARGATTPQQSEPRPTSQAESATTASIGAPSRMSQGSLPFSALVSPHAPCVACSVGGATYHMRDQRKPPRVQPTGCALTFGVGSWRQGGGSPTHAWLFFVGFVLFPFGGWRAFVCQSRGQGGSEGKVG